MGRPCVKNGEKDTTKHWGKKKIFKRPVVPSRPSGSQYAEQNGMRRQQARKTAEKWRPIGGSNPCSRRERAVSWTTRRMGRSSQGVCIDDAARSVPKL